MHRFRAFLEVTSPLDTVFRAELLIRVPLVVGFFSQELTTGVAFGKLSIPALCPGHRLRKGAGVEGHGHTAGGPVANPSPSFPVLPPGFADGDGYCYRLPRIVERLELPGVALNERIRVCVVQPAGGDFDNRCPFGPLQLTGHCEGHNITP